MERDSGQKAERPEGFKKPQCKDVQEREPTRVPGMEFWLFPKPGECHAMAQKAGGDRGHRGFCGGRVSEPKARLSEGEARGCWPTTAPSSFDKGAWPPSGSHTTSHLFSWSQKKNSGPRVQRFNSILALWPLASHVTPPSRPAHLRKKSGESETCPTEPPGFPGDSSEVAGGTAVQSARFRRRASCCGERLPLAPAPPLPRSVSLPAFWLTAALQSRLVPRKDLEPEGCFQSLRQLILGPALPP